MRSLRFRALLSADRIKLFFSSLFVTSLIAHFRKPRIRGLFVSALISVCSVSLTIRSCLLTTLTISSELHFDSLICLLPASTMIP
uniref:Uncharacterized protein n=1 Tax=Physcomitrium patens TaxID=3218 RepID=A0A7I3ZUX3_PHYPA